MNYENYYQVKLNDIECEVLRKHIERAESIVTEEHKSYLREIRDKVKHNFVIEFNQEEKELLIGLLKIFILDISKDDSTYTPTDNIIKKLILT